MNKIISFLFAAILLSVNLPALSYSRINANEPLTYASSFVGDDLGVTGIVSPAASATPLCYSNAETVTATIKNFGAATIDFSLTPAVIKLKVTGTLTQTLTNSPTGTLAAGASMNVTFAPAINMSALGPYNFSIYSSLPGDVNLNNDTLPLQTRTCGLTAGTVTTTTASFCGSGAPVLTYSNTTQSIQWEKATAAAGPWSSATASVNYTVTMPSISVKTYYRVKLTCNGNLIYSNSVSVNVVALPVVTLATSQGGSPIYICWNQTTFLYASSSVPAISYQWYRNSTLIYSSTSNQMILSQYTYLGGDYSVMVTTADGCTATSNVITAIQLVGLALPSAQNLCQGSGWVQLSLPIAIGPFQWQRNGVNISGATSNVYYATQSGTYTIWSPPCNGNGIINYPFVVTIDTVPASIITPSGTQNICVGQSVTLSANTGTGLTYQWKKDGTNISGATGSTYAATAAGNYTVNVINMCGPVTSPATTVTVTASPPAVITPQGPTNYCYGDSVILTANTDTGLTYQWRLNNSAIAGATNSSYTVKNAAGNYSVVITNTSGCSTISSAIPIIVNVPLATITPQGAITFCSGGSVNLKAYTANSITYQWQLNSINIPGANGLVYTATLPGSYTVIQTYPCSSVTSAPVIVTVNPLPSAVITAQGPTNYCYGDSVILTANTDTGLTYQWRLNNSAIAGAANSSYTVKNAAGNYSVVTTNTSGCSTISSAIPIIVNVPLATITPQGAITFCSGGSVNLKAYTANSITYQWQLNSINIPGANGLVYTATLPGSYTVIQTYPCSSVTSAPVTVTVNPFPITTVTPAGPTAVCVGGNVVLNADTGAGLSYQWQANGINISGAINVSYTVITSGIYSVKEITAGGCEATSPSVIVAVGQTALVLQPGGANGKDGSVISYSTFQGTNYGSEPGFPALTWTSSFVEYNVRSYIQFDLSSIPSNAMIGNANLSLYAVDSLSSWGQHASLNGSNDAWLQRVVSSWDESTLTWNNRPPSTTTNRAYLPSSTSEGQNYLYINVTALLHDIFVNPSTNFGFEFLQATEVAHRRLSFCSSDYSDGLKRPKLVLFYSVPDTAIITPAGATSVCAGNPVLLNANTGTGLTYQWKKNGANISGASGSSYNATTTGSYAVAVTGACNTVTSAPTTVTVNPLPTAAITAVGPTTFCNGGSVILNAPVNANYTYQWKKSGVNISGATSSSYTATSTGTYKVSVTNALTGCSKTTPTAISVTRITPVASITAQGPTTFCNGGSVVLQANTGTGFTYKWKKGSNYISGATASTYTATKAGTYKAEVTDGNGCSKLSAGIVVTVPCREGEMIAVTSSEINATLFPNPYSETFTLLIDGNENELYKVTIKDVLGKTIEAEKSINAGSEISLGEKLSPGFYVVELVSGDKRKMLRVEKMK